ncbi:MAG: hypothetical protein ACLTS6_02700 [Anaerobutyricum sp.]
MIRHTAKFIFQIVFYAALAAVVIYIMGNGLGLVNGLDFGAGGILLCRYSAVWKICKWKPFSYTVSNVVSYSTVSDMGRCYV